MANREKRRLMEEQSARRTVSLSIQMKRAKTSTGPLTPEEIGRGLAMLWPNRVFRSPESFSRKLKTRDPVRIATAYALHMFAKYSVPCHVRSVWSDMKIEERIRNALAGKSEESVSPNLGERLKVFFIVGEGGSLYKSMFRDKLTKKEVHTFLTCPHDVDYLAAFGFAIARSFTDDHGRALRISKSRLVHRAFPMVPLGHPLFRETIRFFCTNDVPLREMDDLTDYIVRRAIVNEHGVLNDQWSYRGRSVASLKRQMTDWHYELRRMKTIGGGSWVGAPIHDEIIRGEREPGRHGLFFDWKFEQIHTGNGLAQEGTAMHHCVASYKYSCTAGNTAIFSLKRSSTYRNADEIPCGWRRALTVELRKGYSNDVWDIVQARGFANRPPSSEELAALNRWANIANIRLRSVL